MKQLLIVGTILIFCVVGLVYAGAEKKSYWDPDQLKINALKLAGMSIAEIKILLELPSAPEVDPDTLTINGGDWLWIREDLRVWRMFNGCEPGKIIVDLRSKE